MKWVERIPFVGKFRGKDAGDSPSLASAALVGLLFFVSYIFLLHPVFSENPFRGSSAGGSFHLVYGGDAPYVVLAVAETRGGEARDTTKLPHIPTSQGHDDIDLSADVGWMVAMDHWGCPYEVSSSLYSLEDGGTVEVPEVAGKELATVPGGTGFSSGLPYALAQASFASGYNPGRLVAATGSVSVDGEVFTIGGLEQKLEAAVASGADLLLIPEENLSELSDEQKSQIDVVAVSSVAEALEYLGFPSEVDCSVAVLR